MNTLKHLPSQNYAQNYIECKDQTMKENVEKKNIIAIS